MIQLPDLAEEVLEKIFKYLDTKDVRNLLVVCKKFNFVVGGSLPLMDKFMLVLDCQKLEPLSKSPLKKRQKFLELDILKTSTRKYQNLQILNLKCPSDSPPEELLEATSNLSKIKYLLICHCQVSNAVFRKLMENFAGTLKVVQIEKTTGLTKKPTPIAKNLSLLKEIRILFTDPLVLNHFLDTKIDNLMIMCESYLNYYPLIGFLEKQEDLKFFNLSSSISIFAISNLEHIKFQLSDLTINFLDLSEVFQKPINSNFDHFMQSQKKTLKNLHLTGGIYSDCILKMILNQMPCLKSLHINCFLENSKDYNFEHVVSNDSITNFVVEFPSVSEREINLLGLLKFMKNLKSLEAIRVQLRELFLAELEHLEVLKLTECEIGNQIQDETKSLKNLKQLELRKVPIEVTKYLIQQNPGIEKLIIDSFVDTEILTLIKSNLKDLKILDINFPIPELNRLFSNTGKLLRSVINS